MEKNKDNSTRPEPVSAANTENDISRQELQLLDNAGDDVKEEAGLQEASLDNSDNEGEPLNEESFTVARGGADLDVPGAELDDENEALGEEDEENNAYSLGGDGND